MGLIFKTPSDDAVEGTLRQLHMANQVDRVYERTWGWVKVVFFSCTAILITSGAEYYIHESLWENTLLYALDYIISLF